MDRRNNEDLMFLTFFHHKIGVSVHFKVTLTKVKDTYNERLKKKVSHAYKSKTNLQIMALNISIQPVFSYIMPSQYDKTSYFQHKNG